MNRKIAVPKKSVTGASGQPNSNANDATKNQNCNISNNNNETNIADAKDVTSQSAVKDKNAAACLNADLEFERM